LKNFIFKLHSYYKDFFRSSELRKGITKVYSGDVLSNIIGMATALFVIRGLPINDYAAYTAFYSMLTLVPWLVGSGINMALVRFSAEQISRSNEKPIELYVISFIFQLILYLMLGMIMLLLSNKVSNILFGQKAFDSSLHYGLIAGVGYLISQAGRGVYNAEEKFGSYIKALWLRQSLVFLIIALLFLLKRLNFQHAAQVVSFVELAVAGIITFHIFQGVNITKIIKGFRKQSSIIKEFISSTKWLIAYFFILTTFQRLDIFMLSHFSSEKELANYGVAFRYYSIALLALSSIHAVLLPRFSKLDMQDLDKQRQFSYKWLKTTVWLIVPIAVADIFGKSLFVLVNGMQYEKAFHIFTVLSVGILISLMFSPLVNILLARKAFKFLFMVGSSAFFLNFAGNYFLIPAWGGLGAALVVIFTGSLINIASWIRILYSTK
jgi:O-antigen/teichoic acid export membrane protein